MYLAAQVRLRSGWTVAWADGRHGSPILFPVAALITLCTVLCLSRPANLVDYCRAAVGADASRSRSAEFFDHTPSASFKKENLRLSPEEEAWQFLFPVR